MDSTKSSYVGSDSGSRKPKMSAADKLKAEIQALRTTLTYHENRRSRLVADKDTILTHLSQSDFEMFKKVSAVEKEEILLKLSALDYKIFKKLESDLIENENDILKVEAQLRKLEKPRGKK